MLKRLLSGFTLWKRRVGWLIVTLLGAFFAFALLLALIKSGVVEDHGWVDRTLRKLGL